jgi:succinate dehydrogenase/fumarate reductase cytochrome b subunit
MLFPPAMLSYSEHHRRFKGLWPRFHAGDSEAAASAYDHKLYSAISPKRPEVEGSWPSPLAHLHHNEDRHPNLSFIAPFPLRHKANHVIPEISVKNFLDKEKGGMVPKVMFIWLFHRISGVFLIGLFATKILSSYFLFTKDKKPDWALSIHRNPIIDVLILVLFTFHSLYGLRTIAIDLGYKGEKQLFWLSNVLGCLISAALIFLYARVA